MKIVEVKNVTNFGFCNTLDRAEFTIITFEIDQYKITLKKQRNWKTQKEQLRQMVLGNKI